MQTKNIAIGIAVIVALGVGGYFFLNTQANTQALPQVEGEVSQEKREASEVSWEEAVRLIENCEAEMIFQTHARDVEISLKDGRRVHTVEPSIDEVFRLYNDLRDECGEIPMATE